MDSDEIRNALVSFRKAAKEQLNSKNCCSKNGNHTVYCEVLKLYNVICIVEELYYDKLSKSSTIIKSLLFSNLVAAISTIPLFSILLLICKPYELKITVVIIGACLYITVFLLHLLKVFEKFENNTLRRIRKDIRELEQEKRELLDAKEEVIESLAIVKHV